MFSKPINVGNSTKTDVRKQIVDLLTDYKFKEADSVFNKYGALYSFDISRYEEYKAQYLNKYFLNSFNLKFGYDKEQLEAIVSIHKNTLVTARAGSGKTQVIAGKAAYLLDSEKLNISDILLLSFNKKAAEEIKERINKFGVLAKTKNKKLDEFNNAMTFHSLAYKILGNDISGYDILMDTMKITDTKTGIEKEFKTNEQLKFIQKCFYDIYKGDVKNLMETDLVNELSYFKHSSYLDNDDKYLQYRKNKEYYSISGDYVRSKGEKLLIDFLYEYGFDIKYEPYINLGNYLSKPDIQCNIVKDGKKLLSRDIIIEHWGYNKQDVVKKFPIGKTISGEKYVEIRNEKIKFWENEEIKGNYYFIQTHSKDLYSNMDGFFTKLKDKLHKLLVTENIKLELLSKEELINKVRKNEKTIFPFTKKLKHFISKSQQKHLKPIDIDKLVLKIVDTQERAFIMIANEVYKKYVIEKKNSKLLDFNQILKLSSIKLEKNKCDIDLKSGSNTFNLKNIKYLIVDEYQDFSTLFYMLLEVILKYNNDCRIFVVGDSWQSINSFAGSELGYFFDFRKLFNNESTTIKSITTNYRSKQSIVEMGNNLMSFEGTGKAKWLRGVNDGGEDYTYLDINRHSICENDIINKIFNNKDDQRSLEQAKYIFKNIIHIINSNKGKKIMVISRNNRVFGYELVDWRMKLYNYYFDYLINSVKLNDVGVNVEDVLKGEELYNYYKLHKLFSNGNLEFITSHKSKGKEADIIILLDIAESKFPSKAVSLSSDIKYDRLFGITPESLLKDERRLFYVAVTRAKEKIYILSDKRKDSGLIKELKKE